VIRPEGRASGAVFRFSALRPLGRIPIILAPLQGAHSRLSSFDCVAFFLSFPAFWRANSLSVCPYPIQGSCSRLSTPIGVIGGAAGRRGGACRHRAARSAAKLVVGTLNVNSLLSHRRMGKKKTHPISRTGFLFLLQGVAARCTKRILCVIIWVPDWILRIRSGTITGWSVNAGLGPPVSYPTIVL